MMAGVRLKGKNGLFTPSSFSHIYCLRTVQQSNDKGTWFGWEVSKVSQVEDTPLYEQARTFAESISKGAIVAKHNSENKTSESTHF